MSTVTRRRLKLVLVIAVLLAFVGSVAAAQGGATFPPGLIEPDFWRWVIIQGGLLVALIGALWSYRKDLVEIITKQREYMTVLVDLIKDSTAANGRSAAASEATEKALHRLARALETMEKRIEG